MKEIDNNIDVQRRVLACWELPVNVYLAAWVEADWWWRTDKTHNFAFSR